MNLIFHSLAMAEANEAFAYYETAQPGLGESFWSELEGRINQIVANPKMFRDVGGARRANLKKFPYYIIFYVDASGIEILTVAHVKREPNYWTKRMKN